MIIIIAISFPLLAASSILLLLLLCISCNGPRSIYLLLPTFIKGHRVAFSIIVGMGYLLLYKLHLPWTMRSMVCTTLRIIRLD